MLRICPVSPPETAESSSFLKVDPRKKQVTIMDPASSAPQQNTTQKRGSSNQAPPKMFAFDAAFPHDASQVGLRQPHREAVSAVNHPQALYTHRA